MFQSLKAMFSPQQNGEAPPVQQQQSQQPPLHPQPLQQPPQPQSLPQQQLPYGRQGTGAETGPVLRRLPTVGYDAANEVCAVILTVMGSGHGSTSYDRLFREVKPKPSGPGTSVAAFELNYEALALVAQVAARTGTGAGADAATAATATNDVDVDVDVDVDDGDGDNAGDGALKKALAGLARDLGKASSRSVVLNFECCGDCGESKFPAGMAPTVMRTVREFVDRGRMVMFGDFSTKALIGDWDAELLGPCVLVNAGACSRDIKLRFDPQALVDSPSSQLEAVGEICAKGVAHIGAMSNTIVLGVDQAAAARIDPAVHYSVSILTVAAELDGAPPPSGSGGYRGQVSITDGEGNTLTGMVGHVALNYGGARDDGGGVLLVSAGHWLALQGLEVDESKLVEMSRARYGPEFASKMSADLNGLAGSARSARLQQYTVSHVQQCAPSKLSYNAFT